MRTGITVLKETGSSRRKVIRAVGAIRQRFDHRDHQVIRDARRLIPVPDSGSRIGRLTPAAPIGTPPEARWLGSLTTILGRTGQVIFHNG